MKTEKKWNFVYFLVFNSWIANMVSTIIIKLSVIVLQHANEHFTLSVLA